jgi:hypothetical protein
VATLMYGNGDVTCTWPSSPKRPCMTGKARSARDASSAANACSVAKLLVPSSDCAYS